jgi:hypothetical protein
VKSVGVMIEELYALLGTEDLNPWEKGFVESIRASVAHAGGRTSGLTEGQVTKVEEIWAKHFA